MFRSTWCIEFKVKVRIQERKKRLKPFYKIEVILSERNTYKDSFNSNTSSLEFNIWFVVFDLFKGILSASFCSPSTLGGSLVCVTVQEPRRASELQTENGSGCLWASSQHLPEPTNRPAVPASSQNLTTELRFMTFCSFSPRSETRLSNMPDFLWVKGHCNESCFQL